MTRGVLENNKVDVAEIFSGGILNYRYRRASVSKGIFTHPHGANPT